MNKIFTPLILFCGLTFLLMLSFLLVGCILLQVREEVKTLQKSTVFAGIVSSSFSYHDMPVVVSAYSKKDSERTIVHYTTLHEPGPYELMVPNPSARRRDQLSRALSVGNRFHITGNFFLFWTARREIRIDHKCNRIQTIF